MLRSMLLLLMTSVVLPLFFLVWVWRGRPASKTHWALTCLTSGSFLLFWFFAGRWDVLSYYLRFAFIGGFLAGAVFSYRRVAGAPIVRVAGRRSWFELASQVLPLSVFGVVLVLALQGFSYDGDAVALSFPLKDGVYYVAHGGGSRLLNAHHVFRPQAYALDIGALNAFGARARGLYPRELSRYAIYGRAVYAPCSGIVVRRVDGRPDLTPPASDRNDPSGNTVAIACGKTTVILAHLQRGSLLVRKGDLVVAGQPVGRVGNSGNTSEPHLHIHVVRGQPDDLVRGGEGLPMTFGGRFLVRNTVVRP